MALFSKKQPDIPRRRQDGVSRVSERATEGSLGERYAFRRNRTLTGSASSQVVSTNESNAQLKSSRVQAHELARQRRHIGGILSLVLLGAITLAALVSQFTSHVVVRTSDVTRTLEPAYAEAIDAYLSRQPIERLRFLLREDALNEYVQSITPEVASVRVDGLAGLGKSLFIIEMRQPIAGWSIRGTQQYVDASGTSFARNHYSTPQVQIIDNSGVQVEVGQAVASNQFLGFVGRVVGLSNAQQHTVTQVVIPQGTTRQIELHTKDVGFPIKLSIDRPAGEQVEDMTRALVWLKAHGVTPEYLDVRVSGRAFYR
jgi:cell division septal protein FtsQ